MSAFERFFAKTPPGAPRRSRTDERERRAGRDEVQDVAVGVDLIEIDRVAATLERFGSRFLERVYTDGEIAYCRGRAPQLAARFAAKEAAMKALGTGTRGVGWREVEVTRNRSGEPGIALHGRAVARANALGVDRLAVSLSHSRAYAVASVVARVR